MLGFAWLPMAAVTAATSAQPAQDQPAKAANDKGAIIVTATRRKQVLEPMVARYKGRIFKVAGDGALIEYRPHHGVFSEKRRRTFHRRSVAHSAVSLAIRAVWRAG